VAAVIALTIATANYLGWGRAAVVSLCVVRSGVVCLLSLERQRERVPSAVPVLS
jgi:hypothetical protein